MDERRHTVAVTRRIPSAGLDILREHFDLKIHDSNYAPNQDDLRELLSDADGALVLLSDRIDDGLLDACPRLKVIANYAVGYENINLEVTSRRGIVTTNTPDVLTGATADIAITLMLCVTRRILEADACMRNGAFEGWYPTHLRGLDIHGKRIGIVGLGRIGTAVARRARAFGLNILYTNPGPRPDAENELAAVRVNLETLIANADIISVHCPYRPELHHLFNADAFAAMKSSAVFINTARGKLMDEAALCEALKSGQIAGAGLDVYENEPQFVSELASMNNVVLLPHIGSATHDTRTAMSELAARNVVEVLQGRPPLTPIVKEDG